MIPTRHPRKRLIPDTPPASRPLCARVTHLDTDQIGVLDLDGQPVEYVLRRSLRRSRAMLTLSDRGLVLAAPVRMSTRAIDAFIELSRPWLRRHLPRWRANSAPAPELSALHRVLMLGEPLDIDVVVDASAARKRAPKVVRDGQRVNVRTAGAADPVLIRGALRAWMQGEALPWFEARALHFAPQVGVAKPPIRLTNARTLWGSCTPAGLVRLNWRLLQAPPELIDYVVVHELAHLIEANHSPRFWAVVARTFPAHREARRELTEWQRRLATL